METKQLGGVVSCSSEKLDHLLDALWIIHNFMVHLDAPGRYREELSSIIERMGEDNQCCQHQEPTAEYDGSIKEVVQASTEKIEREMIAKALEKTNWHVTAAAKELGLSRRGLQLKMSKYRMRRV